MTIKYRDTHELAHKARTFAPDGSKVPTTSRFKDDDKARETGERCAIECVLPFNSSLSADQAHKVFNSLDRTLCASYGGFSRDLGRGAWLEDGLAKTEQHVRYCVLYDPRETSDAIARDAFEKAARQLGERWLHVELREGIKAAHVDVRAV